MKSYIYNSKEKIELDHIFDCGQCFRWDKKGENEYVGTALGKIVRLKVEDENLIIENTDEKEFKDIWFNYLDLGFDYEKVKAVLSNNDEKMKEAIKFGHSIKILNQDFWEMMISFVISQNNNIPRIKGSIRRLTEALGEPIGEFEGEKYYSMPTPERLSKATVEDLAPVRLGYRDKYLIRLANEVINEGGVDALKDRLAKAKNPAKELVKFTGIGPKVANCITLFGLHRLESFPIDVWMRRAMNTFYGFNEDDLKGMQDYAKEHFGEFGGIAQQYIFYYTLRNGKDQNEDQK